MDSNGTRFLLLADAGDFAVAEPALGWDRRTASFGLRQRQELRLPRPAPAAALIAWRAAEVLVLDDGGQIGRLASDRRQLLYSPQWPAQGWEPVRAEIEGTRAADLASLAVAPVTAPGDARFTDLHLGGDGIAALPFSDDADAHGLVLVHLRARWRTQCPLPERPIRAWIAPPSAQAGGAGARDAVAEPTIWVVGATRLIECAGRPLPLPYRPQPERFEPLMPNPTPLRVVAEHALPAVGQVLALAADAARVVVLATRDGDDGGPPTQLLLVKGLGVDAGIRGVTLGDGIPFATDIALLDGARIALLAPREAADTGFRNRDCAVMALGCAIDPESDGGTDRDVDRGLTAELVAERYPLHSIASVRFVRALDGRVRYLADDGPRELVALPQARFPGGAAGTLSVLDSGQPDTLWHRLLLEGCIPHGCSIGIEARVSDQAAALQTTESSPASSPDWNAQQPPAWVPRASELPWDRGRLTPIRDRQGLFEVLLQRPNGAVRELRGRYLQLRLTLRGDGRTTPRIAALRAWFPRPSWQQAYLPQHFHQQERPPARTPSAASDPVAANGADVRERLLAAFEGLLTPIEGRIASAEVLLDPAAAPAPLLDPLGALLASRPPPHWPELRRRRWIGAAGRLQRCRGTLAGLALALDIATDGLVAQGRVVPVENYRLRRTLATVLGIDLSDDDHPLTLGTGQSGNSIIGDSLILTDEDAREFLALFAPELAETEADRETVDAFFDRYARRLTVVLHGSARARRRTVAAILDEHAPAAVQAVIRETEHAFILGLSPLLGIDTLLEPDPPFGRVRLGDTRLGQGDLLRSRATLAPEEVST